MIKGAAMMGMFALMLFAVKRQEKKRLQPAEIAGWSLHLGPERDPVLHGHIVRN
jgi:hypothetical protein